MTICIVGAGAIGGLLAVKLANAGEEVTVVARGAHLAAIRAHGLTLAASVEAPGIVRNIVGNRFALGEIDGAKTERIARVSEALTRAGLEAPLVNDLRTEIWTKLRGNMTFDPIRALTHATLEDMCRYGLSQTLASRTMREARAVAEHFGIRFRISIEMCIADAEAIGAHKTSMLQDVESGRPIEADALVGSVIELARWANIATPHLDTIHALVKLLGETLERGRSRPAVV